MVTGNTVSVAAKDILPSRDHRQPTNSTMPGTSTTALAALPQGIRAVKVAILGGGTGGTALLDLLTHCPNVEVVGLADQNPDAPGVHRAQHLHLSVTSTVEELLQQQDPDVIIDVTGDPHVKEFLITAAPPHVEILSGAASRFVWDLVNHETQLHTQLMHADKLAGMGSFAAGIAHDINNPLQLILGLAEGLADEQDPETIRSYAKDIIDAVKRTSAICRDLTRYARREGTEESVAVCLNTKLDEALRIAHYAVGFQDIVIEKQYVETAIVQGHPEELLHVFVNLIVNAIHAMEAGGRLTVSTELIHERIRVRVSDTGCGIAPEHISKIFEPFFTTKSVGKGTGLGLYNVKSIVEQHLGVITVDSTVGVGTTFWIEFPHLA
jgi:signal transduction histidine kinase